MASPETSTTSPGLRKTWGLRAEPAPAGAPKAITVPASNMRSDCARERSNRCLCALKGFQVVGAGLTCRPQGSDHGFCPSVGACRRRDTPDKSGCCGQA